MTYHLHTESLPNLPEIIARHFSGATITYGSGLWRGHLEPTAIIEIAAESPAPVLALAADIRITNHQESVMVESIPTMTTFCDALDCLGSHLPKPQPADLMAWTERSTVSS